MARRQRTRSTLNQQNKTPEGSHQSVEVNPQQSQPIANGEPASLDDVQIAPPPSPEPDVVPDVVEDLPKIPKKNPKYWDVEVIDEEGHIVKTSLSVKDIFTSTNDPRKVIVKWNSDNQPVGQAAGLLAGFLGETARKFYNFPIIYVNWKEVPGSYKDSVYLAKVQDWFAVNNEKHKKYILSSLGKHWRDAKCRLFDKYYNWEVSLEENLQNHPPHVDKDHWAVYVRRRLTPHAMEISQHNAANRDKLAIPHTLGSKTLALKHLQGRETSWN